MEKGFVQMKLPPYLEIWGQVEDQKLALSSGDFEAQFLVFLLIVFHTRSAISSSSCPNFVEQTSQLVCSSSYCFGCAQART